MQEEINVEDGLEGLLLDAPVKKQEEGNLLLRLPGDSVGVLPIAELEKQRLPVPQVGTRLAVYVDQARGSAGEFLGP